MQETDQSGIPLDQMVTSVPIRLSLNRRLLSLFTHFFVAFYPFITRQGHHVAIAEVGELVGTLIPQLYLVRGLREGTIALAEPKPIASCM